MNRYNMRDRKGTQTRNGGFMSILWIILIVVLVLALLGFFSRGAW
jgi:flagellar basal body-associated protein FliL